MNNILDNEVVKKYFFNGCECTEGCKEENCVEGKWFMAYEIIQAMQEPIRKGERYLEITNALGVQQKVQNFDLVACWHPIRLRLPDKFQKRECACGAKDKWEHTPTYCGVIPQPQRDEVEEKIKAITELHDGCTNHHLATLEERLRELVRLVQSHD